MAVMSIRIDDSNRKALMKLSEFSFSEWNNEEDEIYNNL